MKTRRNYRSESNLKIAADLMTNEIVIRTMEYHRSNDIRRKIRAAEKRILMPIIYGALLGLNSSDDVRSDPAKEDAIINAAEYTCIVAFHGVKLPETAKDEEAHPNTYDAVYIPLHRYVDNWRKSDSAQIG